MKTNNEAVEMGTSKDDGGAETIENLTQVSIPVDLDDPHRGALDDNPEHAEKLSPRLILAIISLSLSYVCPISCGFILIAAILVQIGTDLGDTDNITWIVGGWSIASSVSFSIAGSLSDIFGRRYTIILGEVLAIVGSIIGCTAKTTLDVAAGSTIIGFGCGIIFVSYAGISELLPNKWRGTGIGFTETCITIPWSAAGVLIATYLNSRTAAGWRWCYYIGIIYGVISLAGTVAFYFPPKRPQFDFEKTRWQQIKEIDYIGCTLYATGLTSFLVGLTWGGQDNHPWRGVSVLVPLILGAFLLLMCFVYDFTLAKQPFFPPKLFLQVREFTLLLVIVFVAGMVYYSMAGLLPQGSLYMFTNDPIEIGIIALPNGFSQLLFGGILTLFMGKIGHLKLQLIVLLTVQTVFIAVMAAVVPNNRAAWMAFQFFAIGPFALLTLVCYVIAGLNVPLRHIGLASGLIGTFRSAGGSVGNAVFTTVLRQIVNPRLGPAIVRVGVAAGLTPEQLELFVLAAIKNNVGVPGSYATLPEVSLAIQAAANQAIRDAYAVGFRLVFFASIPFGVVAIICACLIRDPSVYLTNHTSVHMESNKRKKRTTI
ncbi:putative major facilitator superfamily transporter [Pyrenochaeta sp. DS3sAY3a]|nr:putative major facilitator superfamily transporter [Pyrenochaeta sp. DS3sAY3a]